MRRPLLALPALLAALLLGAAPAARAADDHAALVDVPVSGPLTVPTLQRLGFDVTEDATPRRVRVVADPAERARLAAEGFAPRVVVGDLAARAARDRALDASRAAAGPSGLPSGRQTYRYPSDYASELDALAGEHPGLVRRVDLPRRSVQGRPITGVEIATDVTRTDDGRPAYVVMGLHHAREWPSGEVNMELALDLVQSLAGEHGAADQARVRALLDHVRVFVFPVINPDGFLLSRGTSAEAPGTDPLQRKNAAEVDLNRNYGAYWGGNGASVDPTSDTYRGPGPWSEPESAAVHELSQHLQITNFQSIHNVAALVLRPPGFRALGLAPDEPALKDLGDRMTAAAGGEYRSQYGYELYEVTGATEDWNYVAQNAFGYTIELGGGQGAPGTFQGPYQSHVVQQYLGTDLSVGGHDGVREALLLAGEEAADPRYHAVVEGAAPAGRVLRLHRDLTTDTSPVCLADPPDGSDECGARGPVRHLDDALDSTLTVPASGRYVWHVDPSTRPFVRAGGGSESWTYTCERPDGTVLEQRSLTIGLGERRTVDLGCGAADAGGGARPGGGAPGGGRGTSRRLRLSVAAGPQRRASVLRRGLRVRARCSRRCTLRLVVRRAGAAPSARAYGGRTVRLPGAGRVALRVPLTPAARRALRARRTAPAALALTVTAPGARSAGARRLLVRLTG